MAPKPNPLLELIAEVDNVPLDFETNHEPFYRLFFATDPRPHGYIHPSTIESMPWPTSFTIDHATRSVTLSGPDPSAPLTPESINLALQEAVDAAIDSPDVPDSGVLRVLNRSHSEPFRVLGARGVRPGGPFVQVERFASGLFGIACRGAHLTAFVRPDESSGELLIWVGRRSRNLFTYPGFLDSTVAGGVKASHSPTECILAESVEEASLPEDLVRSSARATGVLTLASQSRRTELFHGEVLYVYDMELPRDVVPKPGDDEVEGFELLPASEVRRRMENHEFKPNVNAVLIDFFVRHGIVSPDTEGESAYVDICTRLHRRLPVPTSPDE